MSKRNEYRKVITFNHRRLQSVIIDQHYQEKHPDMSDDLILELLVSSIEGKDLDPEDTIDLF